MKISTANHLIELGSSDRRFFEAYSFDAIDFAWEDGGAEQNEETWGQGICGWCGWWWVPWVGLLHYGRIFVGAVYKVGWVIMNVKGPKSWLLTS